MGTKKKRKKKEGLKFLLIKNNTRIPLLSLTMVAVSSVFYFLMSSPTSNFQHATQSQQYFQTVDVASRGPFYFQYPWITKSVTRVEWPEAMGDFTVKIPKLQQPVILTDTVITKQWKAVKHWSPEYIKSKLEMLYGVQSSWNQTFSYFHANHPMSNLPTIKTNYRQTTYDKVNMSSTDFVF